MKHSQGYTMLASAALLLAMASSPLLARDRHDAKQDTQYPDATRVSPKNDLSSEKEQKALVEGLAAANAGDKAKAEAVLQPIIDGSKSKYAQAKALQGLSAAEFNGGDHKRAIDMLQKALAINSLPNDDYFQVEYTLAYYQLSDAQYQASLDTLAKWRAEGKKETAESYAIEGNDAYRLHQYPQAIAAIKKAQSLTDKPQASWNQILMASYSESGQGAQAAQLAQQQVSTNPNDPNAVNNAVALLMQQKDYPGAIQLMEKARASGALKTPEGYRNLATLYFNAAQSADDPKVDATKAVDVMNDGLAKGVLTPDADNELLLGEAQDLAGDSDQAMATFNKALPMAKDGEVALQAANLLLIDNKFSEARSMVQQAIDKGVKHKGIAYLVLAESERGLHHKPAQIAALKLAAQQPETADKANASLKKLGAGK